MTAHELAKMLLDGPDLPVTFVGPNYAINEVEEIFKTANPDGFWKGFDHHYGEHIDIR